ncbi:hypothetical protein [Jiangella muralis]|uniref:hypothetical protein n=1 Tax=Jiangella muralis TaxID=702383 RepID=UPI0012FBF734|nr:hypothetical protein [Jiangella muralis]
MAVISESVCPICSSAELAMMVRIDSLRVFAECENCHSGFWSPSLDDLFTTVDLYWERRAASLDEACGAQWPHLVVQGQMPADDEPPAPEDVAAFYALERVPLKRIPRWAAEWLVQGYDGDGLRELAGEHGDDPYRIKDLLPLALDEMGVPIPANPVAAVNRTFNYLARRCLAGALNERKVAALVDHLVAAGGFATALYELPLGRTYGLIDEWAGGWGRTEEALRHDVRHACEEQVTAAER